MAGVYEPGEERPEAEGSAGGARLADGARTPDRAEFTDADADTDTDTDTDTAELVAQIRELAAHDPAGVQQVVSEVLAALDRATRGAFREQLSDGTPFGGGFGEPPVRVNDLESAALEQRSADTG